MGSTEPGRESMSYSGTVAGVTAELNNSLSPFVSMRGNNDQLPRGIARREEGNGGPEDWRRMAGVCLLVVGWTEE